MTQPARDAAHDTPVIDERGRLCPRPIIALATALRSHAGVVLLADDAAAEHDVPAWCRLSGALLESSSLGEEAGHVYRRYVVSRGAFAGGSAEATPQPEVPAR